MTNFYMVVQLPPSLWIVHVFLTGNIVFLFHIFVWIVYKDTSFTHLSHFFYILKFCDILKCLIFIFHICFLLCAFFYFFCCCCYNLFSSLTFGDCPPAIRAPASPSFPLLPQVLWEASIDLPQTTPCRLGGIIFLLRWDRFLSIMGWIVSPPDLQIHLLKS